MSGQYEEHRTGKPKVIIFIDTIAIGGPGKGLLQFLKHGGTDWCTPLIAGFWQGPEREWQFRDAVRSIGVRFETLRQRHSFDPTMLRDAWRLVRDNDIEILQSHGYKAHLVCLVLHKLTGLPWVAFTHGWTTENLKMRFYNLIDKGVVRFATRIVPVSRNLGERLKLGSRLERKKIVIANAADYVTAEDESADCRERYGVATDEVLLGVVGRLSPEKGHGDFVEAFSLLAKKHNRVKAVFIGDGQERKRLAEAVRLHGLEEKIIFAGYQKDMAPFYKALDVVVLPSLAEGMPNVALEAMMFGKPVVATNIGGIPEVVLDGVTGYLVEPENPPLLADALEKLMKDPRTMHDFGRSGKLRVLREFDPQARARRIVEVYNSLL